MSGLALMRGHLRDPGDSAMCLHKQRRAGDARRRSIHKGEGAMSRTRQLLCVFYVMVALTALVLTWSQNLLYFTGPDPAGFGRYVLDLKVNGAARSFSVDIGLVRLA